MATKGSLWSTAEVQCLIDIWADESIQKQLDSTHKNSEIFGRIRDYLCSRGYKRTIDQCREKLKKLRAQYLKVRDALRRSGSSSDEKDRFPWYDAVDKIIGLKPSSQPCLLQSCETRTPSPSATTVPENKDRRRRRTTQHSFQRGLTVAIVPRSHLRLLTRTQARTMFQRPHDSAERGKGTLIWVT
ncbi:myb/SANT-like DNA-binding domain-containing protein 7 [Misgurnus anguillicaudatus]|uniref:myb/SANT-like DNA-binding domain-containing protein 7 n=1 Tax=Misgurnus anguillicaudatus TaxID=75329 RepID=UPI003CCFA853